MNRQRVLSSVMITAVVLGLVVFSWKDQAAISASQRIAGAEIDKDSLSDLVKELQKQVMELQKQAGEQKPHVFAAGTVTWKCPDIQRNNSSTRVKLPRDVVAGLGKDYIVLLTSRLPDGFPYFVPHWKQAPDGFDITPVDTTVTETSPAGYGVNRTYLVDWAVVKK